jgi:1,4-dihydroxy-2-naphthoate polyprenyltransferase
MTFKEFISVTEIRTKVISLSSFFIGTLFAVHVSGSFSVVRFFLMLIAVLGVDMGTTALNSYFDHKRGVDSIAYTDEKDKVLVTGTLHPFRVLLLALSLFGIAALFGLALAFKTSWVIIAFGTLGMAIGFLYNGGPFPISRTPSGEIFAGGFLGPVLITTSFYAQNLQITLDSFLASLPSLFLIASILTVNNTCDIQGDTAAGRKTLSILLGKKRSEILIYTLGLIAALLIFFLAAINIYPRFVIYTAIPAVFLSLLRYRRMHTTGYSHKTKGPSMMGILSVLMIMTGAVILGLFISIL